MSDENEVGAPSALPTVVELMMAVYAKTKAEDRAELHRQIVAQRDWYVHAGKLLTQWADLVRVSTAEEMGSQRAAAEALGVKRRTVRPRGKAK